MCSKSHVRSGSADLDKVGRCYHAIHRGPHPGAHTTRQTTADGHSAHSHSGSTPGTCVGHRCLYRSEGNWRGFATVSRLAASLRGWQGAGQRRWRSDALYSAVSMRGTGPSSPVFGSTAAGGLAAVVIDADAALIGVENARGATTPPSSKRRSGASARPGAGRLCTCQGHYPPR
jgi:hypothetical protein